MAVHPKKVDFRFLNFLDAKNTHIITLRRGGMFVATSHYPPHIDSVINFEMHLLDQDTDPICGQAMVRWVRQENEGTRPKGVGLEFIKLDEQNSQRIQSLWDSFR